MIFVDKDHVSGSAQLGQPSDTVTVINGKTSPTGYIIFQRKKNELRVYFLGTSYSLWSWDLVGSIKHIKEQTLVATNTDSESR